MGRYLDLNFILTRVPSLTPFPFLISKCKLYKNAKRGVPKYTWCKLPTNFVWKSQIPLKVKSFAWLVAQKKVKTNDMLPSRRLYKAFGLDVCVLCMEHGELVDHLYLHCSLTMGLWHKLFRLAKLDWIPPRSFCDTMTMTYRGLRNSSRGLVLWKNACLALIWVVWWERNAKFF